MKLYMKTTKDKYELPLCVTDSIRDMAELNGIRVDNLNSMLSRQRHGKYGQGKYHEVFMDDMDMAEWIDRNQVVHIIDRTIRIYMRGKDKISSSQVEFLKDKIIKKMYELEPICFDIEDLNEVADN